MTYVDNYGAPFGRMRMCHMMADSTEELNAMADKIGVARKWIQKSGTAMEHYDICLSKRALAIQNGAKEIGAKDMARIWIARRDAAMTHLTDERSKL